MGIYMYMYLKQCQVNLIDQFFFNLLSTLIGVHSVSSGVWSSLQDSTPGPQSHLGVEGIQLSPLLCSVVLP